MSPSLPPSLPAASLPARPAFGALAACIAAACVPSLLAYNEPPSPTAFNQLAALALWPLAIIAAGLRGYIAPRPGRCAALLLALGLVAAAALASGVFGSLPVPLTLSALGLLAVTALLVLAGDTGAADAPERQRGADASSGRTASLLWPFLVAWLVAGILSSAVALVQVFAPGWVDGTWIARSGLPGRAVGNMRQPNHLSSLLLWSAVAVVPLWQSARLRGRWAAPLFALFVLCIELSGSRTGGVGVVVLALWGLLDKRLAPRVRGLLLAAPVLYAGSVVFMNWWGSVEHQALGAATRVGEGDLSSSRFGIWANTLALIRMHPWAGVGFGEFNFAWTLTPFPGRPVAFFDHTHNLPLQLAVELGLPLAALVLALLALALWQAWRRSTAAPGAEGAGLRAAFVMVLLMALHSQLEYPLWYAYFLLPTGLAWGLCLGAGGLEGAAERTSRGLGRGRAALLLAAGLAVLGSGAALADYLRVVAIFAPGSAAGPLPQRIASGQRAWFFAHHADYAAATTDDDPAQALPAAARAAHFLLDGRLMASWALALAAQGDLDRARYVAQRLLEFHKPEGQELFAVCEDPVRAQKAFQCQPPERSLRWTDFR